MKISVIIATREEEKNIESCLKSIIEQSYPQDKIEIIVVDNNSDDKTKEIAESYKVKDHKVQIFNYGPERSAQRNFGVEKSSGEYFLYLDADMILHKDVIRDCVEFIENCKLSARSGSALGGKIENCQLIGLYISEIVMGEKFFSKVRRFERSFYDATVIDCCRFIKRETFQKVGGFDENFTGPEDWDLDKKLRNVGKACPVAHGGTGVDLIKTPIYHNEAEFDLKKYLSKKGYYAKTMDSYIAKWSQSDNFQSDGIKAKIDPDIQKQFGFYYRFIGVFVENGKWKKMIYHPFLTIGMYFLRGLVGIKFLMR